MVSTERIVIHFFPGSPKPKKGAGETGGAGLVIPGTYRLEFSYRGNTDSTLLTVKPDPRMDISIEAMKANYTLLQPVLEKMQKLAEATDRLKESRKIMQEVNKLLPEKKDSGFDNFKKLSQAAGDSLKAIRAAIFPPEHIQGLYFNPKLVTTKLQGMYGLLFEREPYTETQKKKLVMMEQLIDNTLQRINAFFNDTWAQYQKAAEEMHLSPFNRQKE